MWKTLTVYLGGLASESSIRDWTQGCVLFVCLWYLGGMAPLCDKDLLRSNH